MTLPLQTLAISGDAVFGLVAVAIWIWLSVMSKRSKSDRPPPPPAGDPDKRHDPQTELRKFFETLEKGLDAPAEAMSPEAKPAETFHRPQVTTPSPVPRRAPKPRAERTVSLPVLPAPAAARAPPPFAAVTPGKDIPDIPTAPIDGFSAFPVLSSPHMGALRFREGLRHAIIAAEILGPPVSMRQQSPNIAALNVRP